MTEHTNERAIYKGPAVFAYGFRPFFLGSALFAGMAVPAWILILAGSTGSDFLYPARDWHVHEMVFGFLPGVITGFLLTAIPNWTDRPPIRGHELMWLFALWCAGRLCIVLPGLSPLVTASVDSAFLVTVAGLVWREIAAGRCWSRAPMGLLISLYAGANILFHVLALNDISTGLPERMALGLMMVLLTLIGGRVTHNFTDEFLADHGSTEQAAPFSRYDALSVLLVAIAAVAWTAQPEAVATGGIFIVASLANLGRLLRWRGWLTWPEPLVLILHLGYGWLTVSLFVLGCSLLEIIGLPNEDAVHALTTGAVGVMTLAVMTRASLGHTGRARHAGPWTVFIYLLVTLGALIRVLGPTTGLPPNLVFVSAAACWSGAYLLFAVVYGPFLLRPSLDE